MKAKNCSVSVREDWRWGSCQRCLISYHAGSDCSRGSSSLPRHALSCLGCHWVTWRWCCFCWHVNTPPACCLLRTQPAQQQHQPPPPPPPLPHLHLWWCYNTLLSSPPSNKLITLYKYTQTERYYQPAQTHKYKRYNDNIFSYKNHAGAGCPAIPVLFYRVSIYRTEPPQIIEVDKNLCYARNIR